MRKTYYITTPIYYPSNNLHLGHTYTTIIADTIKRFKTIQGYDVHFVTGTDEHGMKLYEAAKEHGLSPLEYIDPIVESAKALWKKLDIQYDSFVRSSSKEHEKNVQQIFQKLYDQGDIYKDVYKGHYCVPCEAYFTEKQLVQGHCPDCGRPVEYHEEESYFFRLSNYQDRLVQLYKDHPDFLKPDSRRREMFNNFLAEDLEDLSVSRTSFDWGVKVPFDEKHVIYVWIDALSCYLTGIGYGQDQELFEKFWPANLHLVGKEIVRFHAIIWPALLMALGLDLPQEIFGHGWILFDEDKMSKSKGNVMYAEPMIDLYGVDALKYFILREFTLGQDGNFTSQRFLQRMNSDLTNDLGNLVSRTVTMVEKYFDGQLPEPGKKEDLDQDLIRVLTSAKQRVEEQMDQLNISAALEEIWQAVRRTNKYIDETEPWVLIKEDQARLQTVLYNLCESLRILSILITPFIHHTAERIQEQLSLADFDWAKADQFGLLVPGSRIHKTENLFPRLDIEKETQRLQEANEALIQSRKKEKDQADLAQGAKEQITIDDFARIQLKTGRVLACDKHPDADKLFVLTVDLAGEERTIVSGIKQWYQPEDLIGKNVIVCTNLKPVKLRGIESNGMLLAAQEGGDLTLLTSLDPDFPSGAVVS